MKFVGLVSGGKDSIFNIMQCIIHGHELIGIANLSPPKNVNEIDSFMYQTVGSEGLEMIAKCLEVPLIQREIKGKSIEQQLQYNKNSEDEVEDLFRLLQECKEQLSNIQGVSSGAILSNYQRLRIEDVCGRLGLSCLSYLWKEDQATLLNEMIESGIDARIIKVCSMGLHQDHLMQTIKQLQSYFQTIHQKFGFNQCGEGGEYETFVLDSPIYKNHYIQLQSYSVIMHDNSSPDQVVAYVTLDNLSLIQKTPQQIQYHSQLMNSLINFNQQNILQQSQSQYQQQQQQQQDQQNQQIISNLEDVIENKNKDKQWIMSEDYLITKLISVKDISDEQFQDSIQQLRHLLEYLKEIFQQNQMQLDKNCIQIILYINQMSEFQSLNSKYKEYFSCQPPVRVCIEHCENQIRIQAIGFKGDKQNLHVQSISKWAPANIGPYSQANLIKGTKLFLAGQIGMMAVNLELVKGIYGQYQQIINNYYKVIQEITNKKYIDYSQFLTYSIVYLDQHISQDILQHILDMHFNQNQTIVIQVNKLPKGATIEVEVMFDFASNQGSNIFHIKINNYDKDIRQSIQNQFMALIQDKQFQRIDIFVPLYLQNYQSITNLLKSQHILKDTLINLIPVKQVYHLNQQENHFNIALRLVRLP